MANFTYALGPWVRRQLDAQAYWDAPDHASGRICLGSLPACALSPAAEDHRPVGLFCFEPDYTPSLDYLILGTGDCRELQPSAAIRDSAATLLGVSPEGNTIADWLGYWIFSAGDPTGQSRWKLGTPTKNGEYEIYLSGHSRVWAEKFVGTADKRWNSLRDLLRNYLKAHDDECKAESQALRDKAKSLRKQNKNNEADACGSRAAKVEFHAEKVLDAMCRKYGCAPSELSLDIQTGKAKTTLSDDFSSDTIADYTAGSGSWSISGGACGATSGGSDPRVLHHNTPLSADDHYTQGAVLLANASGDPGAGPACRKHGSNITFYAFLCYSATKVYSYKFVDGAITNLDSGTSYTFASGAAVKLDLSGTTFSGYYDGTLKKELTDSSISGNLYTGLAQRNTNATRAFGDFYATDGLVAGNPYYAYAQQQ